MAGRGSGRRVGAGIPRSAMPSAPCTCRASTGLLEQRARLAPTPTGTSPRPAVSSTTRVLRTTSASGALPPDAGHRPQVEPRVQRREEEGAGVVDTGVDVEDHGEGRHGVDHGGWSLTAVPVPASVSPSDAQAARAPPTRCQRRRHRRSDGVAPRRHVPSSGALRRRPDPADPPPGRRRDLRPAGPRARRLRRRPSRPATSTATTAHRPPRVPRRARRPAGIPASRAQDAGGGLRGLDPRVPDARSSGSGQLLMVGFDTNAPLGLARRPRHERRTWATSSTSAAGTAPTRSPAPPSTSRGWCRTSATGDVGLHDRRRPGGRRGAPAARGGLHPPAVGQGAGPDGAGRADQGRRRLGARARRPPGSTSTSPRSPTPCPTDDRPRQRADRPVRPAVRLRPADRRARLDGVPRGDARGRRRGHGQALPGAGPDPQQHRLQRPPASPTTSPTPTTPSSSRSCRESKAGAGLVMVGSARYSRLDPKVPGDVLRADRHRPAARATSATTGSSSPTTSTPGPCRATPAASARGAGRRGRAVTSCSRATRRSPARCSRPSPTRRPRTRPSRPRSTRPSRRVLTLKERMGLLPCSTESP